MWSPPPHPASEAERLADLERYGILDTLPEERFDRITRLATRYYGADCAFLSFIDADQQWMKSKTNDALHDQVPRDSSVCTRVVSAGSEVVIDDLWTAPEFEGHPLARSMPWRFYAGVPLLSTAGHVIGTLCIMRSAPGAPEAFSTDVLKDLAAISSHELTLARSNAELHRLSNTDALTGLGNRRMFDEEFQRAWRRTQRTGRPASLLILDLDHFKEVNDTLGHAAGDHALSAVGAFLRSMVRRPDDFIARIGGEEFALLLSDTDATGADAVAHRLLADLAAARIEHPIRGILTASIGTATLDEGESLEECQRRADRGLYAAKAAGRSAVRTVGR